MLRMKNHFDISGSIEIHEVDIAGVACISLVRKNIRNLNTVKNMMVGVITDELPPN